MPIALGNSINDLYDFSGSSSSVVGIDYRGYFKSSSLFGEIARSQNSALAGIIGVESGVGNSTDLAILYRNYAKDFQSIFGDGFGESSGNPQNEKGWYFGLKHQISNRLSGSFYFDQYQYLAPRNGVLSNSSGNDVLLLLEGNVNRSLNAYILIRNEVKEVDLPGIDEFGREVLNTGEQRRSSLRIQAEYFANRTLRSRSRPNGCLPGNRESKGSKDFYYIRIYVGFQVKLLLLMPATHSSTPIVLPPEYISSKTIYCMCFPM